MVVLPAVPKRWFPRTLLAWEEPKAFARWRAREEIKAWPWRGWSLLLLLVLVIRLGPKCVDGNGLCLPPASDTMEAMIGLLTMLALPCVDLFVTTRVVMTERGFVVGGKSRPFTEVGRVDGRIREIDGRRYTVLAIVDGRGKTLEVGVADTVSLPRIEEILGRIEIPFGYTGPPKCSALPRDGRSSS